MNKYIYQKFLLNCEYENIEMSEVPIYGGNKQELLDYHCDYCIFDFGKDAIRRINITDLDEKIDSEEDWDALLGSLNDINSIVLCGSDTEYSNPIIENYRKATVKAYIYRLLQSNKSVYLS